MSLKRRRSWTADSFCGSNADHSYLDKVPIFLGTGSKQQRARRRRRAVSAAFPAAGAHLRSSSIPAPAVPPRKSPVQGGLAFSQRNRRHRVRHSADPGNSQLLNVQCRWSEQPETGKVPPPKVRPVLPRGSVIKENSTRLAARGASPQSPQAVYRDSVGGDTNNEFHGKH